MISELLPAFCLCLVHLCCSVPLGLLRGCFHHRESVQSVPLVASPSACKVSRNRMSSVLPLRVTTPLPWHFASFRAVLDLLTAIRIVTTLGPSRFGASGTMASADSRSLRFLSHSAKYPPALVRVRVFASLTGPPGVRHNSFAAQPPDLLLRFYVYPWGFSLFCNLTHRLASYPVSIRRLAGFATPLPPLLTLLSAACGSLHLAVNTRGGTFTRKNCAMPGTHKNRR